jgi:hypothetical protein
MVYDKWEAAVQRVAGRYYDPSLPKFSLLFLLFGFLAVSGARDGIEGAVTLTVCLCLFAGWYVYQLIRSERRWRA